MDGTCAFWLSVQSRSAINADCHRLSECEWLLRRWIRQNLDVKHGNNQISCQNLRSRRITSRFYCLETRHVVRWPKSEDRQETSSLQDAKQRKFIVLHPKSLMTPCHSYINNSFKSQIIDTLHKMDIQRPKAPYRKEEKRRHQIPNNSSREA